MVRMGTGWRQDGTGSRGTLEAGRGWFLMVQAERESERSIRGKGVSGRTTGCYSSMWGLAGNRPSEEGMVGLYS